MRVTQAASRSSTSALARRAADSSSPVVVSTTMTPSPSPPATGSLLVDIGNDHFLFLARPVTPGLHELVVVGHPGAAVEARQRALLSHRTPVRTRAQPPRPRRNRLHEVGFDKRTPRKREVLAP